jgi:iron-sulfur cluster assembly accessory protein
MINITEAAGQYITHLLADAERQGLALRLAIAGQRPGGYQYKLGFVREDERAADDVVIDAGGFRVFIDAESAPNLQGATLDFVETPEQSGFRIHNPKTQWTDPKAIRPWRTTGDTSRSSTSKMTSPTLPWAAAAKDVAWQM